MKITPVKGTFDYLPEEVRLRDYLQTEILKTYQSYGFERISTPALEDIDNLSNSEGGENLALMFKVLKRGAKLNKAIDEANITGLADMGLRYDLTLPLARYYANNRSKLPNPFKVIQIDRGYRAEQPQRGRKREFIQCDIDIVGVDTITAEIELIYVTAKTLLGIGLKDFMVRVNDRSILREALISFGFEDADFNAVCMIIDKLDKIGISGLKKEFDVRAAEGRGFGISCVERLLDFLSAGGGSIEPVKALLPDSAAVRSADELIQAVSTLSDGSFGIEYDFTLVRGQGYYTGAVFEIMSNLFKGSIAGGGRYNNMIGKFINQQIPAVGFSIGFERIADILSEIGCQIPGQKQKSAVIYDDLNICEAIKLAEGLQSDYVVTTIAAPKKVGKLINKLTSQGYTKILLLEQGNVKDIQI